MYKEFKEFLLKQNALALAIGVIIGAAIGKVVSSIVEDVLNPIVGLLLPGGNWRDAGIVLKSHIDSKTSLLVADAKITYGHLIGALVDFALIGFVVFLIAKAFIPRTTEVKPETKECPECRTVIPTAARRCLACAQVVA